MRCPRNWVNFSKLRQASSAGPSANTEVALEFKRGDVVLRLRQQVHGQELTRQAQVAGGEDRAADDAALVPTGRTLPVEPAFAPKRAVDAATALRAGEALGPARLDERGLAGLIAAKSLHEFSHRQTALELHLVHGHDSPLKLMRSTSVEPSAWRELYRARLRNVANQEIFCRTSETATNLAMSARLSHTLLPGYLVAAVAPSSGVKPTMHARLVAAVELIRRKSLRLIEGASLRSQVKGV